MNTPRNGVSTADGTSSLADPAVSDATSPAAVGPSLEDESAGPATATAGPPSEDGAGTSGAADSGAASGRPGDGSATTGPAAGGSAGPLPEGAVAPGEPVVVSYVAGFSGPYGSIISEALNGLYAWLDEINGQGGILGRPVVIKEVDHRESAAGGVSACKEVLSNGSHLAFLAIGIDAVITATDCLDRNGFPSLYFASAEPFYRRWRHSYSVTANAEDVGRALASFVEHRLDGRRHPVGVIVLNGLQTKATADAFVDDAAAHGLDVVGIESVEFNQTSFVPELQRLREAGAEIVTMFVTAEVLGILRDARAMRYQPEFTGMGYTFDFLAAAARDLMSGVSGVRIYATIDSPAFPEFTRLADKHGRRKRAFDGDHFFTYGYGLVIGRVLEASAPYTRASLFAGIESIENYDNQVDAPITWGPGDYIGTSAVFPVVCCRPDWAWKSLGPAAEQFG
ncbi:MAG TPA: ABC transporter substrate-binding protein [Acidimicrobiales bacterium]|nr:ABC transporter substrate-binding protein [Acidimicrobiales bacterium]